MTLTIQIKKKLKKYKELDQAAWKRSREEVQFLKI